jgi:hypothetical protein
VRLLGQRVTRRIDRLARRAHAFHRFAHHPLCDAYAGELVRLGRRTRVCRGCACVYGGAGLGLVSGVALRAPDLVAMAMLAGAVLWLALSLVGQRGATSTKLRRRALPGVLLGYAAGDLALVGGFRSVVALAIAGACLLALSRRYRQRGPDRSPCLTCPEYGGAKTCRGFAPIVRRERAFMRLASRWIAATAPAVLPPTEREARPSSGIGA